MEVDVLTTEKASTLPKWLLDMKAQLETSKTSHKQTEEKIAELQGHVKKLSDHIDTALPSQRRRQVVNLVKSHSSPVVPHPTSTRKQKRCFITLLPNELLSYVMYYCDIKSIHQCEVASKLLRYYISHSNFWLYYFQQHFAYMSRYFAAVQPTITASRQFLIHHFDRMSTCVHFLTDLKNEHFVSRHAHTRMHNAHHILCTFLYLTCFPESSVHALIVEQEGIRIFVKFLAHDSGLLHQLACDIIANVLFAHHVHNKCFEDCVVCRQLQFSNARRILLSLLTSPTATVTLSTTQHNIAEHISTTTANVQGVACQAASRALGNLFSASNPIPLACTSCAAHYNEDARILCGATSRPPIDTDLSSLQHLPQQLSINQYIPFEFCYYHKSGSLQKSTTVWLRLYHKSSMSICAESVIGKGIDDNGHFVLLGSMQVEITGSVWQLRLIYISHDVDIIDWLYVDDGASYVNMRSQISLKAYWSDGTIVYPVHSNAQTTSEDDINVRTMLIGRGFWGVWEICSVGSHFELQKGGVFRALLCNAEGIS